MAGLADDEMALLTCRSGVARSATVRSGCAPRRDHLQSNGSLIWKRPKANNGDPDDTSNSWTTGRE